MALLNPFEKFAALRAYACRVDTSVDAFPPLLMCARPEVVLGPGDESCLHGMLFNVTGDPIPFDLASDPMVVGFLLPERFTGAPQQTVGLTGRETLQRFQQPAGRNQRKEQDMQVIAHNHEGAQSKVPQAGPAQQSRDDQLGDGLLAQELRSMLAAVQIAVDPHEHLPGGDLGGRRRLGVRKASTEVSTRHA